MSSSKVSNVITVNSRVNCRDWIWAEGGWLADKQIEEIASSAMAQSHNANQSSSLFSSLAHKLNNLVSGMKVEGDESINSTNVLIMKWTMKKAMPMH